MELPVGVSGAVYKGVAACCAATAALALAAAAAGAQRARPGLPLVPLPDGPLVIETAEARIRLVTVTRDLSHPWALAFLPDGRMLVTERAGRLRVIRDGVLDPQPIAGVPPVHATAVAGLMDVALHPRFAENRLVYLTYSQPADDGARVTLARGRLDGAALAGVETLFESEPLISNDGAGASRIVFAPDGTIYVTVGGAFEDWAMRAQDPGDTAGKLLRLRDDGSVPDDNPFVGREGYRPEIYSLGHRNQLGMAIHPETGDLWAHENGPLGGDELNIIRAGANYGWPVVSYSRQYSGPRVAARPWQEGMEQSEIVWLPSVAPSGMVFYDADRFPQWAGSLFVGALRTGGVRNTGHLERIVFNENGEERQREWILTELRQRIRDVRQGPDGLLYVLTDAEEAALFRIEPAG